MLIPSDSDFTDEIASEIFLNIFVSQIFVKEQQAAEQKKERLLPS